ncbi:putative cytochrome P450 120 [Conger conger]|uniref:putative cytochrome P450 120 n=1 Tax=Conger conger TaxID=82655 RepID=UPI002A5A19BE|nr:putative cytochrome P450 120 [Conger conger]
MSKLPGSSGISLLSDKSLEFYRDPVAFYERRIQKHGSRIFETRLLNKSTSFVCSVQGMKELLCEKSLIFQKDPTDIMHHLYGDNIVTANGEEACLLRLSLTHLFTGKCLQSSADYVNSVCENCLKGLDKSVGLLSIYPLFKQLGTELVLGLFLNVRAQDTPDVFREISQLCTQHWHGLISAPLNVKVPLWSSGFCTAMEAKNKLMDIIHNKLDCEKQGFVADMKALPLPDESCAPQHLLLFISALIPKALASLLTSFTLALSGPSREGVRNRARMEPEYFSHVLLEVQRLWPPFIGGRRIANKDTTLGKFHISQGSTAIYVSHAVHRDPEVFHQPEEFLPERWSGRNAGQEGLLCCQGNGQRNCIGSQLNQLFLEVACGYLLKHYDWDLSPASQDLQYKWLPISRPVLPPTVRFRAQDRTSPHPPEGGSCEPGGQ